MIPKKCERILKLRSLVQLIMPFTKPYFALGAFISCTDLILQLVWIAFKLVKFEHWLFVYFFQKIQFVIYFEAVHFFVFHQTNCFFDFYPSCHFNLVNINASQVDMDTDKIGSVLFCYSSFWRLIFDKKECHPIYDLIGIQNWDSLKNKKWKL